MSILVGDNFSYSASKPLDGRLIYSTVASMKAVADSTMYDGCMAYCTATDKTYQWKSTNAVDETTGKWREFTSGGDTIQVSSMPTASASELGKVYQYIGSTTLAYTHGYFYECVSDGESTPTYSWSQVEVSKGGHDIKNDGVAVASRDTMNFTDFDIADDSTNEETDIKAHRLTASELTDICSPLPSVPIDMPILLDETGAEYVIGWHKTSQGKKPVYQKTIAVTTKSTSGWSSGAAHGIANIDKIINLNCVVPTSSGWTYTVGKSDVMSIMCASDSTEVSVYADHQDLFGRQVYVVLQYTKTTDVAS